VAVKTAKKRSAFTHIIDFVELNKTTTAETYLCPSSCATVKASASPVSSLILQLRCGWHRPETCDRPSVLHGSFKREQMLYLQISLHHLIISHAGMLLLRWIKTKNLFSVSYTFILPEKLVSKGALFRITAVHDLQKNREVRARSRYYLIENMATLELVTSRFLALYTAMNTFIRPRSQKW